MEQEHTKGLQPHFFFLSLGLLASLVTSVVSFLLLVFEALNKQFPDVLNAIYTHGYSSYEFARMRGALATLIIFFPIFLVLSYYWQRAATRVTTKADTTIRAWLIYLIIFLSGLVVAIDLITLVRSFVGGEITLRFLAKVGVTLLVAVLVGSYYIRGFRQKKQYGKLHAGSASLLVILLVIFSFSLMGSPFVQRKLRLDEKKIQDLQSLQWQIVSYWQQKKELPNTTTDLTDSFSGYTPPRSPDATVYEYKKGDGLTFTLCATFALPRKEGWVEYREPAVYRDISSVGPEVSDSWSHSGGYTCFERTIDPKVYAPYE